MEQAPGAHLSLLFTGHMIDLPGRKEPRFPQALEQAARRAIRDRIVAAKRSEAAANLGFASGARGGDILFHEECRAQGLRSMIVLPFPPAAFEKKSVAGIPGSDWVERFHKLWADTQPEDRLVLNLPETDEAYGRCNATLLELARQHGRVHLIALWNGQGGDGPGGAADLVAKARAQGDEPDIIDPKTLQP